MKEFVAVVGGIALFFAVVFGLMLYNFGLFSFFAPKYAEVQNQVFHNTQQFNDGAANDIADLRLQYIGAKTQEQKDTICAVVTQRFASYPKERLPSESQSFYNQCAGV